MGNNLATRVRDNTNAPARTGDDQPASLAVEIQRMEKQFALAMPHGAEAAQLIRDAITALRTTRNLDKCDKYSVLGGLMTCAQLGLRPGVLGHAWLLPFWDNRSRSHKAQLIIGYQGYRELAQRSGQISTLIARVVYENDEFDIDYGLADNLVHKPPKSGPRGEAIGYYTIVKYTTGGYAFWHMSKTECEEWRDRFAMARTKQGEVVGPWRDNFDEMATKTTFLRLAKWMPKSTDLAYALEADSSVRVDLAPSPESMLHGEHPMPGDIDGEVVGEEPEDGDGPDGGQHEQPDEQPPAEDTAKSVKRSTGASTGDTKKQPLINQSQQNRLHAQLGDLDLTERDDKLTTLGLLVGRPGELTSSSDITYAEARDVLNRLGTVLQSDDRKAALDAELKRGELATQGGDTAGEAGPQA
jgi:recombination protein RecT